MSSISASPKKSWNQENSVDANAGHDVYISDTGLAELHGTTGVDPDSVTMQTGDADSG